MNKRIAQIAVGFASLGLCLGLAIAFGLTADAVLRNLFGTTILALDDLISMATILCVACCFPIGLVDRSHLSVDLISTKGPAWLSKLLERLARVALLIVMGFLLWQTADFTVSNGHERTPIMGFLLQPVWAAVCIVLAFGMIAQLVVVFARD